VDGEYHAADIQDGLVGAGSIYYFKVDFGTKAQRHVIIEGDFGFKFGGIVLAKSDHAWRSSTPIGPRISWIGDSYSAGVGAIAGASCAMYGLPIEAGKWLGWRDIQADGESGTGYLKTNGSLPAFRDRLATNVYAPNPDIVVVAGGINDQGVYTTQAIQDETEYVIGQIRATLPGAAIIAICNFNISGVYGYGSGVAGSLGGRDAIKAGALAGGVDLLIDNIVATTAGTSTAGWITGTGNVASPGGSGNADVYISSDGIHPTRAGHAYYGRRIASAIALWMDAGCPRGAVHAGDALTVPG
jgi:lysophospholipase L1-like esterase